MPQNAAFDVDHERFTTLAGLELSDVVRAEVVQKLGTIRAGHSDLSAGRNIEERGGRNGRFPF